MVLNCVAYGCSNVHDPNKAITFHTFPFKRTEILKLWIEAIRRDNWYPSKTSRICGRHFLPTDFQNIHGSSRKLLKLDAVPSVFNFQKHLMKATVPRKKLLSRHSRHVEEPVDMDLDHSLPSTSGIESKTFVDSEKVASEALFSQIVSYISNFKCLVAYFPLTKLMLISKHHLGIQSILSSLYECGETVKLLRVHCS